MGRHARGAIIAVAIAGGLLGARTAAQGVGECYGFSRDRTGNIREGVCVASRRDLVFGTADQISRSCESLIVCGGQGDLGDCHLARNVCKGIAAPACNASGVDVFNGPAIQNAACRARSRQCAAGPDVDRGLCAEIAALLPQPAVHVAAPAGAPASPASAVAAAAPAGTAVAAGAGPVSAVAAGTRVKFRLPVENPAIVDIGDSLPHNLMKGPVHVDHDPGTRTGGWGIACRDYRGRGGPIGLPWCYGAHTGTDFMLRDGFAAMDRGGNFIVAAADGEVVEVKDHLYDRCHGELITSDTRFLSIDCGGQIPRNADGSFEANLIRIRHADGLETSYIHIQRGSALVRRGQTVSCGTRIASIGSSGSSFGPHVHFEVRRGGQVVDPYAGPLSQAESLWVAQGPDGTEIPAAHCR